MIKTARKHQALLDLLDRSIRISHYRGDNGVGRVPANRGIMASVLEGLLAVRFASIEGNSLLDMVMRCCQGTCRHQ